MWISGRSPDRTKDFPICRGQVLTLVRKQEHAQSLRSDTAAPLRQMSRALDARGRRDNKKVLRAKSPLSLARFPEMEVASQFHFESGELHRGTIGFKTAVDPPRLAIEHVENEKGVGSDRNSFDAALMLDLNSRGDRAVGEPPLDENRGP